MCAVPVDPVFIDLETRSTCDLRKEGGFRYADNANTRLLTVAWTADMGRTYHVWLPGADGAGATVPLHLKNHLPGVTVHWGNGYVPEALASVAHRPWVGHNAWTFDRQVWAACGDPQPPFWIDTYPLALACGLPGGLDKIGTMLWKEGKYAAGNHETKKASRVGEGEDPDPVNVPVVTQIMIARYNVQDVRLMVQLWPVLQKEARLTAHERRVLKCHDDCNARGVRIDRPFVSALIRLTDQARAHATRQIAELTKDHKHGLQSDADLRSRTKVFAWLDEMGVKLGSSLRRDVVARFIDEHSGDEEPGEEEGDGGSAEDAEADSGAWENIALVVKVLELRMQALRVTGGKLDAALKRTSDDGRLRGWSAYWAAHTGRWAGRGLQPHNFPRPKEGVDVWDVVGVYEQHRRQQDWADENPEAHGPVQPFDYLTIRDRMPIGAKGPTGQPLYPYLSVDDASSALLRSMVIPDEGKVLAAADLANIEARVLAWLAGEEWLMKAFWEGADPYLLMARKIFGPQDVWPVFPDPKTGKPLPLKKHPYRQVGKVVVLGCGYQLGVDKFTTYAAAQGIDLKAVGTTPADCIIGYRRMHPAIAGQEKEWKGKPYFRDGFWDVLDNAAVRAVQTGGPVSVRGLLTFEMRGGHLVVTLPSGRELKYRNAQVVKVQFHKREIDQVTFVSARYNGMRVPIYGGKWAENVVQAVSRDVLAHGFVLLEATGYSPVNLHVHDELASSIDPDEGQMHGFMKGVTTPPPWLKNFPLDAEGSWAPRYAKSPDREWKKRFGDEWVYRNGERLK